MSFLSSKGIFLLLREAKSSITRKLMLISPKLIKNLKQRYQDRSELETVLVYAIQLSRDPLLLINSLSNEVNINDSIIWRAIVRIQRNDTELFKLIAERSSCIVSAELRLKIEIKSASTEKKPMDMFEIDAYTNRYLAILGTTREPNLLKSLFAGFLISRAPASAARNSLKNAAISGRSLTEFQKIKLLSRYEMENDKINFINWFDFIVGDLSTVGLIKVDLMKMSLFGGTRDSYIDLERRFLSLPFNIAREYEKFIKPVYDKIPEERNYFPARFSLELANDLKCLILEHVEQRKSLSMARLGDGECYGLADKKYVSERGISRQERHWWGGELDTELRDIIQKQFRLSIQQIDVLGVPSIIRLVNDINLRIDHEYEQNSLIFRILSVMHGSGDFLRDKVVVEDQSNIYLFKEQFLFDLVEVADKVCIISGIDSHFFGRWTEQFKNVSHIEIPTHQLLRKEAFGSSLEGALPYVYDKYLDEISSISKPGVVFLISAGFIGKIFVAHAAKHGGVALDVGQAIIGFVADEESGK